MVTIHSFVFNDFEVNTYVVENGQHALIIDPAMYKEGELDVFLKFLQERKLDPIGILITHPHLDHIMGLDSIVKHYDIPIYMHPEGEYLYEKAPLWGTLFGFPMPELPPIETLNEGIQEIASFRFRVISTPGHAEGSVCYYFDEQQALFTGDVLFNGSIGRTDLETGNYNKLIESLQKIYDLFPLNTTIYPGHGDPSTLEDELKNNPFLDKIK